MRLVGVSLGVVLGVLVVAAASADGSHSSLLRRLHNADAQSVEQPTHRPFDHRRHDKLNCDECHGTGDQHRTMLVRTARDCASCHHDARRALDCSTCHRAETLPEQREIVTPLDVADSTRARVLPFGHERHASIACADCHQTPVTLAMSRDCRSCHARHEQPDANCASCHAADLKIAHRAEAHLSCGGAGCHTSSAPLQPTYRTTCLACHAQQSTHEPGGDCASCHKVPAAVGLVTAPRRGAQ